MIRLISEDVVLPSDRSRIVDTHCLGEVGPWYVKDGDSALVIANETIIGIPPGDRSRIVDAEWRGSERASKGGDGTLRIANETISARPAPVISGNLSRIVDCRAQGSVSYVKGGDGALRIANETMIISARSVPCCVVSGDRSRIVDTP